MIWTYEVDLLCEGSGLHIFPYATVPSEYLSKIILFIGLCHILPGKSCS